MVYENVTIEVNSEIISAAYYGDRVKLYPEGGYITISIKVSNRNDAKRIFESHNINGNL